MSVIMCRPLLRFDNCLNDALRKERVFMARSKSASNWEQYSHKQMAALAEADLAAQAYALGLSLDGDGRVRASLFGRDYLVSNNDIVSQDGAPVATNHKSILAHYLTSRGEGRLSGEFLPIGRLTGMIDTGLSPSDSLIKPLTEKFGDKYPAFMEAARKIDGQPEGKSPSGGESWLFSPLPKLRMRVIFFEADEEFEAEVKVLFDSSAPVFVAYELSLIPICPCLRRG